MQTEPFLQKHIALASYKAISPFLIFCMATSTIPKSDFTTTLKANGQWFGSPSEQTHDLPGSVVMSIYGETDGTYVSKHKKCRQLGYYGYHTLLTEC